MRSGGFASGLVLTAAVVGSLLVTPAAAKRKPPPPPPPPPPPSSTSSTYVRNLAAVVDGVKCALTPEAVQATADGGSVALALSDQPSAAASDSCRSVNWLVKLDASGAPQWQKLVGCFGLPPGDYSLAVSLQQTADGGYIIGGGTLGCDSRTLCLSQCALVERLDAAGNLLWAREYSAGGTDRESVVNQIRQTSDGGFVAVGTFRDADSNLGALALKLDGAGAVQWQRKIGPGGPSGPGRMHVYFNAVQPSADGGYVAAGEFTSYARTSAGDNGVLVVKLDANGNVAWQRAFNSFDSAGAPTAAEHALSIVQSSDGGFVVAGTWGTTGPNACCRGALLLKLDGNGTSQWQKAYSGGVVCFNYYCSAIGAVVYSVNRTSDGGYLLAGSGDLVYPDSLTLVPWLARVDASGNILWQNFYYESYPSTGGTLSQYFASSSLTSDGGVLALGFTENPNDFQGELFAVRTDSSGLVGGCTQIHPATPLNALDPGLATIAPALPVSTTSGARADVPSSTQATGAGSSGGQC